MSPGSPMNRRTAVRRIRARPCAWRAPQRSRASPSPDPSSSRIALGLLDAIELDARLHLLVVVLEVLGERAQLCPLLRCRARAGGAPTLRAARRSPRSASSPQSPCHRAGRAFPCRHAPGRTAVRAARRAPSASAASEPPHPLDDETANDDDDERDPAHADQLTRAPMRARRRAPSRRAERPAGGCRSRARPSRAG